jgi:HEAT repeat protein
MLIFLALAGCQLDTGAGRRGGAGESILELVGPPTPAEAAQWAVDPNSPDNRQQGLLLLANAPFGGESVYMDLYRLALEDEDAAVRAAGVKALGLHGGPPEGRLVLELLRPDEDVLVRREAARTMARIHVPEAVPALTALLDRRLEPDAQARSLAAEALAQHREPRVVQALIGALADPRLVVGESARASLETLTGRRLGPEPEPWLAWAERAEDLFANAQPFYYTVFQRDRWFIEYLIPWDEPPNEIASTPAGMPIEADTGGG